VTHEAVMAAQTAAAREVEQVELMAAQTVAAMAETVVAAIAAAMVTMGGEEEEGRT